MSFFDVFPFLSRRANLGTNSWSLNSGPTDVCATPTTPTTKTTWLEIPKNLSKVVFFFICLQQDLTDLICIWYAFGWAKSRKTVLIWFDLIRFDRCKDVKMLSSHFSGDDSERSTCYAGSGFQDSRWVRWVRWRCAVRCAVLCAFSEMCCFLRQGCDERVEEDDRGECTWVRGGYLDNAMLMPDTACSNMM